MLDKNDEHYRVIHAEEFSASLQEFQFPELELLSKSTSVIEAISIVRKSRVSVIAVGEKDIEGIVTEDDFLKLPYSDPSSIEGIQLESIMKKSPSILEDSATILDAIIHMGEKDLKHLLIRSGEKIKVILLKDLLSFTKSRFKNDLENFEEKVKWSKDGVYLQMRTHFDELSNDEPELTAHVFETPLRKVMFNESIYCDVSDNLSDALTLMRNGATSTLVVMEYETELKGVITARDFLNKAYLDLDFQSVKVSEIMTPAPHKLLEQDVLAVAIKNMAKFNYRNVIICNQVGYPISTVSILEILRFICSKIS
ncbi:CBS domain-containing protein [Halobacteriovorax marinus]|uniref:CBS domain-containing protein n=1 Tax=Halobacteriovorax marinus TaxID=97084 RepID=UPI003A8E5B93